MLNQAGKVDLLRQHLLRTESRTLVETGIYNGRGSGHQLTDIADSIWMLDLSMENCLSARVPGKIRTFCGDSAITLPHLLTLLRKPALFWLDAHLVAEHDGEAALHENPCPLLAELRAIIDWDYAAQSTVLIDDVRLLGVEPGWPTIDETLGLVREGPWPIGTIQDDILRLVP